jgi:hypothetical protein
MIAAREAAYVLSGLLHVQILFTSQGRVIVRLRPCECHPLVRPALQHSYPAALAVESPISAEQL